MWFSFILVLLFYHLQAEGTYLLSYFNPHLPNILYVKENSKSFKTPATRESKPLI